ncbi:MAG: hypothetical protein JRJ29_11590 [Deltaproteobacteria bacterium]|nr:hypothetical protein [Deltaproteobacteria bacterium]
MLEIYKEDTESVETSKLSSLYTMRIPDSTKTMIDKLSPLWKKKLNERLRLTIAKVLHEANFDPNVYLNGDYEPERDSLQA